MFSRDAIKTPWMRSRVARLALVPVGSFGDRPDFLWMSSNSWEKGACSPRTRSRMRAQTKFSLQR